MKEKERDLISMLKAELNCEEQPVNLNMRSEVTGTTPVYDQSSLTSTTNPLAKILRKVFIHRKVTKESFAEDNKEYCKRTGNDDIATHKGNMNKYIKLPKISINIFERLLNIIGLNISDIKFVLTDQFTGDVVYVGVDDEANTVIAVDDNVPKTGTVKATTSPTYTVKPIDEDMIDEIGKIESKLK